MTTTGLTDDEMRVRIAQACGLNTIHARFWYLAHEGWKWWEFSNRADAERFHKNFGTAEHAVEVFVKPKWLPDYLNDLNAMHAAEKSIKCRHTLALYDEYLRREVNPNTDRLAKDWTWEELGRAARATARQRALAFLAMLPEPEAGR